MAEPTTPAPDDWITSAVDTIVEKVDSARTGGTENVIVAIRALVFGLVAIVFAFAAIVLTTVLLVRLADAYLPIGNGVGDATWAAHLFIGGLLTILGFGLWLSRRTEGWRWAIAAGVIDVVIVVVIVVYGIIDAVR